jgi:hypothetical protein
LEHVRYKLIAELVYRWSTLRRGLTTHLVIVQLDVSRGCLSLRLQLEIGGVEAASQRHHLPR